MSPILTYMARGFDPGALVNGATETVKNAGAQQTQAIVDDAANQVAEKGKQSALQWASDHPMIYVLAAFLVLMFLTSLCMVVDVWIRNIARVYRIIASCIGCCTSCFSSGSGGNGNDKGVLARLQKRFNAKAEEKKAEIGTGAGSASQVDTRNGRDDDGMVDVPLEKKR